MKNAGLGWLFVKSSLIIPFHRVSTFGGGTAFVYSIVTKGWLIFNMPEWRRGGVYLESRKRIPLYGIGALLHGHDWKGGCSDDGRWLRAFLMGLSR